MYSSVGSGLMIVIVESSDEHFSDASEGQPKRSNATSPIPITRVERVDDEPAHGEVPGHKTPYPTRLRLYPKVRAVAVHHT
jgi:hypothetical protein